MKVQINILTWLAHWWFPDVNHARLAIEELLLKVSLWEVTKGRLWVITHLKEMRLLYTRSLCGDPIYNSTHVIGIRKDGLPKGFPILNSIFTSGKDNDIRFILTLLSISRTIKDWKDPDLQTISNPYTGLVFSNQDIDPFIHKFMSDFGIKGFNLGWSREDYYYSTKSGPNGLATWLSIIDAICLPSSITDNLKSLSENLFLEMQRWQTFSLGIYPKLNSKPNAVCKGLSRKLSVVQDPDGKSRIIAIFDYWSQNILKKFNDKVFNILKLLPQDRTFTQDPRVTFEGPYYSFDLSAATDRFPLAFQERVVRSLLGSNTQMKAWSSLLVGQEFYVPWEDRFIKYETGQPMGAYSSWAIFTLSHHIIVQWSAFLIGEYPTNKYILLGDDIVIGGTELAETYKAIMSSLGVGISNYKSHVSTNTYEFAKRWFRNGREVSGLQVNAFMETWKSYPLLFQVIREYYERGLFPKRISTYPMLIETLLVLLGTYERKAQNISRKVGMLHAFYRWSHDGDLRTIRETLVQLCPSDAPIPDETHPLFEFLILMRYDMAYQVIHKSTLSKVNKFLEEIPELLMNDSETFNPDQMEEFDVDIDLDALMNGDIDLPKSTSFGFSDIHNLPSVISLTNIAARLSKDPRISIENPNLQEHISALVVPGIEDIKYKRRNAQVFIKHSVLSQKVLHFHKVLARGAWMFEVQWFNRNGVPMP
jgi:hypothetical protein